MDTEEDQFDKIADAVTEKYVKVVKDSLEQSKIADLKEFYDAFRQEQIAIINELESATSDTRKPPGQVKLELFAEVFKYLDVFPPNLQKPKKTPAMRERLNSIISKSSPTLNDLSAHQLKNDSNSSLNAIKCDDLPKPTDTHKNFQKFQKQLKQLSKDIAEHNLDKEYLNKLQQLHNFSQQLEKVMPKEDAAAAALSASEEKVLIDLVQKMDDMNFIRDNQDIYRQNANGNFNNSQRLDSLADVLTHSLGAVSSLKMVH